MMRIKTTHEGKPLALACIEPIPPKEWRGEGEEGPWIHGQRGQGLGVGTKGGGMAK